MNIAQDTQKIFICPLKHVSGVGWEATFLTPTPTIPKTYKFTPTTHKFAPMYAAVSVPDFSGQTITNLKKQYSFGPGFFRTEN